MDSDKVAIVGKYKVQILRNTCIGAASCIAFSPTVFELDGEKKATVLSTADDTPENIMMAAQACPTKAIVIVDTATGEQIWPK
jgi:ferredoxin